MLLFLLCNHCARGNNLLDLFENKCLTFSKPFAVVNPWIIHQKNKNFLYQLYFNGGELCFVV